MLFALVVVDFIWRLFIALEHCVGDGRKQK